MATDSKVIAPHWIMQFLGAKSATFTVIGDRITFNTDSGERYTILIESLIDEVVCESGVLFSKLVMQTDKGKKAFGGLRQRDAQHVLNWLRQLWLEQLTPDINHIAALIKSIISKGYMRSSRLRIVQGLAKAGVEKFRKIPDETWAGNIDISAYQYVYAVHHWTENDINQLRADYLEHQKAKYAEFFDTVESQPLTTRQREACIIDEDNNLVLAGAGTGKTSVMVGRAGYLIECNQAAPHEILLLAFGNIAAKELQGRISSRLPDAAVTASTFHKLGKEIIARVEGTQPSLSRLAEDDNALAAEVNQWFESHLLGKAYRQLTLKYFEHYLYPDANPFDFESEGDYFDYILANDIRTLKPDPRTLKGELVKSLGECVLANHLFKSGIEYIYEAKYEHPTGSSLHRQYSPDFYLPDYGIYIEYYGIDRDGNTAPYIDREKYHADIQWKRALHAKHNTKLIELYHYQKQEGNLFKVLDQELAKAGVTVDPLPPEALLETLREFGAISTFANLLTDLLKRYRANCYEPESLENTIKEAANREQIEAALKLLLPIHDDYTALLDQEDDIDFDDMIGKAIDYVKKGKFNSPWRFILVDEFQDISDPRARLLKHLSDSKDECSIFCVGDDWQSIYRFAGSDLHYTTHFEECFGATKMTALDLTFRFNNSISDVASKFVQKNPTQLRKTLNTKKNVSAPAVSLLRADNREDQAEQSRLHRALGRISQIAKNGSSVYILGRYRFTLPDRDGLKTLKNEFPYLDLGAYTIHSSKGKEADYIVVLGLESGKHGFPSQKVTHPLLEAMLPPAEAFPFAEERRLFYVALTRAKHRVYLISDMAVASEFVVELLKQKYPIDQNEFEASLSQQLFQLIKCNKCYTGSLVARRGPYGKFYGCNKYPLCEHKERGCESCGTAMTHIGRFKVCINPDCRSWVPTCPRCGAEMTVRKGKYGDFWGCKNYRYKGECCSHTENAINFDPRLWDIHTQQLEANPQND